MKQKYGMKPATKRVLRIPTPAFTPTSTRAYNGDKLFDNSLLTPIMLHWQEMSDQQGCFSFKSLPDKGWRINFFYKNLTKLPLGRFSGTRNPGGVSRELRGYILGAS